MIWDAELNFKFVLVACNIYRNRNGGFPALEGYFIITKPKQKKALKI